MISHTSVLVYIGHVRRVKILASGSSGTGWLRLDYCSGVCVCVCVRRKCHHLWEPCRCTQAQNIRWLFRQCIKGRSDVCPLTCWWLIRWMWQKPVVVDEYSSIDNTHRQISVRTIYHECIHYTATSHCNNNNIQHIPLKYCDYSDSLRLFSEQCQSSSQ